MSRLTRSRGRSVIAFVFLVIVALFWLAALTEPGNVEGVLVLEGLTAIPLALLVRHLVRVSKRLKAARLIQPPATSLVAARPDVDGVSGPPAQPTALAPPDLTFDRSRVPDVALRPHLAIAALTVATALGAVIGFLWLQYNAAYFDARTLLIAIYAIWAVTWTIRARIVVVDGALWRRWLKKFRPLSLNNLATVQYTRARYLRNEGMLPARQLRLTDCYGRRFGCKPVLWAGSKRLLAIVGVCGRTQEVTLDAATAQRLALRAPDWTLSIPAWAYHSAAGPRNLHRGNPHPPTPSTFWMRRNPDGTPKKAQPQFLIPTLAAIAIMVPIVLVVSKAGTSAILSARCNSARPLWAHAPDFPADGPAILTVAQTVQPTVVSGMTGRLYQLTASGIANSHNTSVVRADAASLSDGIDLQWAEPNIDLAGLQLELFPSHAAALAFQRDYAEDHCHSGDHIFSTPTIPGGLGIRCGCTGGTVSDRIAFVRGRTRIQAIAWSVPSNQGHEKVQALAQAAVAATSANATTLDVFSGAPASSREAPYDGLW